MSYRLDKYVWCVRLAKTRSQATDAISKGKVRLNNKPAKPAKEVQLGDEIQIVKHTATYTFRVIKLLERRVGAKLVADHIVDITPQDELEKYKLYLENQKVYRELGTGKPSKKQRRDIDDFLDNW